MDIKKTEWGYVIRLYKGEEIVQSLTSFVRDNKISYCTLSGIGACTNANLSYYSMTELVYMKKDFNNYYEIISLQGNIVSNENQTVVHAHILLSDDEFKCFGGHLNKATVTATCEINLFISKEKIKREIDSDSGLNLLSL